MPRRKGQRGAYTRHAQRGGGASSGASSTSARWRGAPPPPGNARPLVRQHLRRAEVTTTTREGGAFWRLHPSALPSAPGHARAPPRRHPSPSRAWRGGSAAHQRRSAALPGRRSIRADDPGLPRACTFRVQLAPAAQAVGGAVCDRRHGEYAPYLLYPPTSAPVTLPTDGLRAVWHEQRRGRDDREAARWGHLALLSHERHEGRVHTRQHGDTLTAADVGIASGG